MTEKFQENNEESLQLNTLAQKIDFNRNEFRKELEEKNNSAHLFIMPVNDLIDKIRNTEVSSSIEDFLEYQNKKYSLHIRNNSNEKNDNGHRLDIFSRKDTFNTFRADNTHVVVWVGQGGYTSGRELSEYHSEDHWGVSVTPELKGTGISDILYDLKCQVDDQLEFEHVPESNLQFLTFYIKKGYIPYSIIKLEPFSEEIITDDILSRIILEIKEARKNKELNQDKDGDLKLRLDPLKAKEVYERIKTQE